MQRRTTYSSFRTCTLLAGALFTSSLLSACAIDMRLPSTLSESAIPTTIKNAWLKPTYRFGPWEVDAVVRSETAQPEQEKRRLFARSKPKKKKGPDLELAQTYNFNLREEGSRKHHVQCRTVFGRNYKGSFLGGSVTQDQTILSCELSSDAAGAQPDRVDMAVGKRDLPGAASLHGTDFRIVAEYKKAGQGDGPLAITGLNPLGYVMYRDDEAIAAVQTVKERAVWMSDDLKPEVRSRVAAALMAMAYYMPIEPT